MSALSDQLTLAADQFACHSAAQSIDQVEAAAELMRRAAWVIKAASAYATSHQVRLAAEEAYKWADASDTAAESALSDAQAQEKGAHWQLLHECGRAEKPETVVEPAFVEPPAMQAAKHLVRQMQLDGRLAWLIGPGSQSYELLTQAVAGAAGQDVDVFRALLEQKIKPQRIQLVGV